MASSFASLAARHLLFSSRSLDIGSDALKNKTIKSPSVGKMEGKLKIVVFGQSESTAVVFVDNFDSEPRLKPGGAEFSKRSVCVW